MSAIFMKLELPSPVCLERAMCAVEIAITPDFLTAHRATVVRFGPFFEARPAEDMSAVTDGDSRWSGVQCRMAVAIPRV